MFSKYNKKNTIYIKKFFLSTVLIIGIILTLSACKASKNEKSTTTSEFDIKVASNLIENYMSYIMKGDKENLKRMYTEELAKTIGDMDSSKLVVRGYKVEEKNEVGKSGIFKLKIARSSSDKPNAVLDECIFKVIRQGQDYRISEINSNVDKEIFSEGRSLRIRSKNNAKTNLLLDEAGIPNYAFSKDEKANINKIGVPKNNFGTLSFGYEGNSAAITTYGKDTFIAVVTVDESMAVQGDEGKGEQGGAQGEGGAQEQMQAPNVREKPVGKEVVALDLLINSKADMVSFSPNEKLVLVQYTKPGVGTCIRIYRTDNGELIPYKFEENFPIGKVDIKFSSFNKEILNFEVTAKSNQDTSVLSYLGKWQLDLKKFKAKKI